MVAPCCSLRHGVRFSVGQPGVYHLSNEVMAIWRRLCCRASPRGGHTALCKPQALVLLDTGKLSEHFLLHCYFSQHLLRAKR